MKSKTPNLWPKKSAIVVSDSPNLHMLIREMMRSYQWTVIDTLPSISKAAAAVNEGMANLIVIDDTVESPAIGHLRYLLSNTVTVTTPCILFMRESSDEDLEAIKSMGRPAILQKPLTPSKFIPAFSNLIKLFETPDYKSLRQAGYHLRNQRSVEGFKVLLKCRENPQSTHLATQALAILLRQANKIKEAEKMLIECLRVKRDIGTVLSLSELYMHASMPSLVHRLLLGAAKTFSDPICLYPDLMQAAIMMGRTKNAIQYLYHMRDKNFMPEATNAFLARLLYSEGREVDAEGILNNNKAIFSKLQESWTRAEADKIDLAV